ncbi:MAG: arginine--tRNA ligase [Candidatus Dormibacteria bacterium]
MPDVRSSLVEALITALDDLGMGGLVAPTVEPSARPEFGDWSTPVPLRGARVLRRPPMAIAGELRDLLAARPIDLVREWTVSPPGYVNAHLDDPAWAPAVIGDALALDPSSPVPLPPIHAVGPSRRTLIEHTNINTNKAAHIGHLRNACIGDTVARVLRRTGQAVEVNNYIDDTGVQVADVVVGMRELGLVAGHDEPFDQFCSRVYVEVCRRYESEPQLRHRRQEVLRAIEARDPEIAKYVKDLARRVVSAHLRTMRRFDIDYDLLTWESDILELGFWRRAFDLLRNGGHIVRATAGPNAGCWILSGVTPGDEKVLVKSDGVATYTAKDIAYQLWKFGLLGLDFGYRAWDPEDPRSPQTTSAEPAAGSSGRFGHASRVVNVIDARQAYVQAIVALALERLGHVDAAANSIHLAYEVVALSPAAAAEIGIDVEDGRRHYALSGRRGIEVRADELLDRAIERVAAKTSDPRTARLVAAGAIRYYLLRYSLTQIISFDFDEALRTTGETGVYIQYAHARAAGILGKVEDDGEDLQVPATLAPVERTLLLRIDAHRHALAEAATTLAPLLLTTYAHQLATALSDFYEHTPPIVRETDPVLRRFRRHLVAATRATLRDALTTLGMAAPDRI